MFPSACLAYPEVAENPLRQEEDYKDYQQSINEVPVFSDRRDDVPEGDENGCPEDGSKKVVQPPAYQDHHDNVTRSRPVHRIGKSAMLEHGIKGTGKTRKDGGNHQGDPLIQHCVIAQVLGPNLVLFGGIQDAPQGGMDNFPEQDKTDHKDDKNEIIIGQDVFNRDTEKPEDGQCVPLYAHETIFAASHSIPLESNKEKHLGKCNSQEGEVNPSFPGQKEAHDAGDHATEQHAAQNRNPCTRYDVLLDQPADIGTGAEKQAVAE